MGFLFFPMMPMGLRYYQYYTIVLNSPFYILVFVVRPFNGSENIVVMTQTLLSDHHKVRVNLASRQRLGCTL